MKRLSPIAAITLASVLLMGCESRIDQHRLHCARWRSGVMGTHVSETREKLGLSDEVTAYQVDGYCTSILGFR